MPLTAPQTIGVAINELEAAIEADLEHNGDQNDYLMGFRDALSAVHQLVGYKDPSTLHGYIAEFRKEAVASQTRAGHES